MGFAHLDGRTRQTKGVLQQRALVRRPSARLAEGLLTHLERQPVDVPWAVEQWNDYRQVLHDHGWETIEVPAADECPDGVFIEDTMVVYGDMAVISRPGAVERRLELPCSGYFESDEGGYRAALVVESAALAGRIDEFGAFLADRVVKLGAFVAHGGGGLLCILGGAARVAANLIGGVPGLGFQFIGGHIGFCHDHPFRKVLTAFADKTAQARVSFHRMCPAKDHRDSRERVKACAIPTQRANFHMAFWGGWYRLPGSNGGPLDPQSSALTN